MSTSAVSTASLSQEIQQYFQTRQSDLQQLGKALGSGNLAGAQTAFNNITALGQTGPVANGTPFFISQRDQDFSAIGQALQGGDLAGAQQAFSALKGTFSSATNSPNAATSDPASSPGPEIILNLSNSSGSTSPEEITINISNPTSGGGEQVALSIGNQGSTAPQEIEFNLSPNSNEQIVLNLLGESSSTSNSSSSSSSGSTSSSGGLSVSA